jgi:hypothetical protein
MTILIGGAPRLSDEKCAPILFNGSANLRGRAAETKRSAFNPESLPCHGAI